MYVYRCERGCVGYAKFIIKFRHRGFAKLFLENYGCIVDDLSEYFDIFDHCCSYDGFTISFVCENVSDAYMSKVFSCVFERRLRFKSIECDDEW